MDLDITPNLPDNDAEPRLPWHKPEVQRLTVSLDTAIGTGSTEDADGFERLGAVGISDVRVKTDIAGIQGALPAVLSSSGTDDGHGEVNYIHLVPLLVEAIREQQVMIAALQQQVKELHRS